MSGIPSELTEPALADAFSLCLRELLQSPGELADWHRFEAETMGIRRVAMCLRGDHGGSAGVHANIAADNAYRMAREPLEWTEDQRRRFLRTMRQAGA